MQVLTLNSLHAATQLPIQVLSEALLCLTTEGQAVLLIPASRPHPHQKGGQPKSKRRKPSRQDVLGAWGRDEQSRTLSVTRFRRSTVFTLNEEFLNSLGSGR